MKAYDDLILCELDMIFMCDINKDIFNEIFVWCIRSKYT